VHDVTIGDRAGPIPRTLRDRAEAPVLFVVDDDLPTLELLRYVARESGWNSVGFTRLASLRAALERRLPTLLIVDDDLPDGRGGDLARDLRTDPRLEGVPLLVCTAAPATRLAEIGSWAPVVAKPFELGEIEAFLAAAVRRDGDGHAYGGTAG
jgi:DNA-binding response OmpR family regulator